MVEVDHVQQCCAASCKEFRQTACQSCLGLQMAEKLTLDRNHAKVRFWPGVALVGRRLKADVASDDGIFHWRLNVMPGWRRIPMSISTSRPLLQARRKCWNACQKGAGTARTLRHLRRLPAPVLERLPLAPHADAAGDSDGAGDLNRSG